MSPNAGGRVGTKINTDKLENQGKRCVFKHLVSRFLLTVRSDRRSSETTTLSRAGVMSV